MRISNPHFHIENRARTTVKAEEAKAASEAGIESDAAPTAEEDQQEREAVVLKCMRLRERHIFALARFAQPF